MQTDIAANSDSTFTNSHGARSPLLTIAESASTMCVCGEIGYAPITSGRQRATASATAREPSSCLSMRRLRELRAHVLEGVVRGGGVGLPDLPWEAVAVGVRHRIEGHEAM